MKHILTLMLATLVTVAATAIPAKRVQRTVTINGRQVTLTLTGDENLHYWQAEDGTAYNFIDEQRVERLDLAAARANMQIRQTAQMQRMAEMAATPDGMRRASQMNRAKYSGQKRGLVILANFKDKKFTISNPQATYQRVMSEEGYNGNGQYGSVRDYFKSQSYGQFDFVLDVVGPVTLSQNMAYYGANRSSEGGSDIRPAHMAKEACELADKAGVDFTQYDWDGDGEVEQVFIIYAGYGEAQGAAKETVWPHAWVIEGSGSTLYLDGKKISSYACGSELAGASGTKMDGIGTICHEFSHCFGLPDFYCTDYNHSELTMSYWSLMDHGSYSNSGYTPTAYTAYERWFCGWLEPKELKEPQTVTGMQDITTEPDAYILYNQKNRNEYYIMYNVQQKSWNSAAYGHGMLVLHVDYNSEAWTQNTPNNDASHLRMTPICADNERGTSYANSFAGDPYPGTKKNTSLTDSSKPAATLFNANTDGRKFMGKPIEEITEKDGLISFKFDGGVPVPETPTNVTATCDGQQITFAWDAMEYATKYDVEYGEFDQEADYKAVTYLRETFDFGLTSDASSDISEKMGDNGYPGYSGTKLYKGKKGLKLGSSSANGYINTPMLEFGCDEVEVTVKVSPYNSTLAAAVSIIRLGADGKVLESGQTFDISADNQTITATLSTKDMHALRFGGSKGRMYLQSITVREKINPYGTATRKSVTTNSLTVKPNPLADAYYYRVRALNSTNMASDWNETQTLIVNAYQPPMPPAAVPQNLKVEQEGMSLKAEWDEAENAEYYRLEYHEKENANWTTIDSIPLTTCNITLNSFVHEYEVRVQAVNGEDVASDWSETVTVPYDLPMGKPEVTIKDNGDKSFTVSWDEVENAILYKVEVGEYDNQTENLTDDERCGEPTVAETTTETSLTIDNTDACAYYARVAGFNLLGEWSEWSERQIVVYIETGIGSIAGDSGKVIYNLSGQRVNAARAKGLYIVNGEKVIINR